MKAELQEIASQFALEGAITAIDSLGEGFINDTFIVRTAGDAPDYILQRKNKSIFPDVPAMMENIRKVTDHIRRRVAAAGGDPRREAMTVVVTRDGKLYHVDAQGEYWAVSVFISDTIAYNKADSPELARKGGEGIGKFQAQLADFTEPLAETVYLDILSQAQRYVYIYTPYLAVGEEMLDALKNAAKRGVDVRLILPGIPDKKLVFRLSRSYYLPLLRAGVRIYEFTPGFLHAKCYVSDDRVAVVGSINMDYRSLFLHFECGTLLFHNSQIAALRKDVERTLPQCREIMRSDCRTNLPGTALDGVLRLLSPLM